MWDFLFEQIDTGEQFFVECDNLGEASIILELNGFNSDQLKFCGRFTPDDAEIMELDTL